MIEPTVLFYVGYSGISEREQRRNIRTCSCEISLAAVCERQRDGAPLRFRSNWKVSLIDTLIGAVAKNLPPGVVNPKLRSFELACDKLRSDKFALSRVQFSKYRGDGPSGANTLLSWLTALELQPRTMNVAVNVNLPGFNALLQGDSVISFASEDNAIPDREEVLGDGSLQAAVYQQEVALADIMQGIRTPGETSELDATEEAMLTEIDCLCQELCDSRRKLEESRRHHMKEVLSQEQLIRSLQDQLHEEFMALRRRSPSDERCDW